MTDYFDDPESGNPLGLEGWIPAFAGMTDCEEGGLPVFLGLAHKHV